MQGIEEVRSVLSYPKRIIITSHRNPDGDAIGSSLAVYQWLMEMGHQVMVAFPSEYPAIYNWMPGINDIKIHDLEDEEVDEFIKSADVHVILDYNSLSRIDKMGDRLSDQQHFTILIDHHLYPDALGDFILSDTSASSTCELVYRFIKAFSSRPQISPKMADCLYTGIVTDTGSFQYSTSPALFRTIADLMDLGVDNHGLNHMIFNNLPEKSLRLLGHCLYNRMEILDEYNTGIIFLNKHDFQVFDIQRGDTEGIVNYLLKIKHVHMAAFFRQQPSIVKISFRSKGHFSVEEIAKNYFNGGGHRNAAGGYMKSGLAAALKKFKEVLPIYKEKLTKEVLI